MRERIFAIIFLVFQLLITNELFGYTAAEESQCECTIPIVRLGRSLPIDNPELREEYIREIISRLETFFERINLPLVIKQDNEEIVLRGDPICADEEKKVADSILNDNALFGTPIQPLSTNIITGQCAPASGSSPLQIAKPPPTQSLLPLPLLLANPPVDTVEVQPTPEIIPPLIEILPLPEPVPLPVVNVPPAIFAAFVIPAFIIPEVFLPAPEVYEAATGVNDIIITAASGSSPLRIGNPLPSKPLPPLPLLLAKPPAPEFQPLIECAPAPLIEIIQLPEPDPLPAITLPPIVNPVLGMPAYIIPEVVVPTMDVCDMTAGDIYVTGNDIVVTGDTHIEGDVPTLGEVSFSGYVPAKGTITIYSYF